MSCNCIEILNKELAEKYPEKNTKLDLPMYLDNRPPRVLIKTTKRDENKRVKPLSITASFCPFCGKEYDEAAK